MQPAPTYDYLCTTRARILQRARGLSDEQYARTFPIGLGTLGRTLTHVMISEWYYVQRIERRDVPEYDTWPIKQEDPPPLATIESTWTTQAASTRDTLAKRRDWTATIEYAVTLDDGRAQIVTTTAGDLFTQLVLHEVHHRSQAMNILRQLGTPVDDLDYNSFFARRPAPGSA